MATPNTPGEPAAGTPATATTHSLLANYDDEAPRVIRVRLAPWDVACTVALLALLLVLATATAWPDRLFGFLEHVCADETCGPVPFGVDYYIRPIVWGGIGAAIAAAVLGPIVSLLKGWYMSFWPVLALALTMLSALVGSLLTVFSERYWA
ncbi:hypothetical protein BRW65_18215 [Mycobacterium paraffinicum]|uniref:Uncharacterized protein n=1 Tax=Mycobacterium paraffinicum TaxID=53378 RepID=A0A1Q4HRP1_9MYCO|nr:hypothetical protein [Mycobacterium paraffinicum]OJZ71654.1 hypothetical protein BRW65_18215 [Mycobacterium paraffinicum]